MAKPMPRPRPMPMPSSTARKSPTSASIGAGNYEGSELPAPVIRLHQLPARHGDGFTLRIDDIAVGKHRRGPVKGVKK